MQFLFEIDDVFHIRDRGCVLVPGIPFSFPLPVRPGAGIVIISPTGDRLETTVAGYEMINRGVPTYHAAISLPRTIRKESLVIGSRVFLLEHHDKHMSNCPR